MKQETKRNIKVYSVYILIFVVGFLGAFFIQKVRYEEIINEVSSYTPEIVYRKSYNSRTNEEIITPEVSYGDWFNENKNYNFNYFRAFNKKYLVLSNNYFDKPIIKGILKNQLIILLEIENKEDIKNGKIPNYKNRCIFEQELKKYTNKNFVILNLNNEIEGYWIVDFETDFTKKEIYELENKFYKGTGIKNYIKYNEIILPKYFNDKGYNLLNNYIYKHLGDNL